MAVLYESMLWVNHGAPPQGITGKISEIQITFSLLCVTKPTEVNAVEVFQSEHVAGILHVRSDHIQKAEVLSFADLLFGFIAVALRRHSANEQRIEAAHHQAEDHIPSVDSMDIFLAANARNQNCDEKNVIPSSCAHSIRSQEGPLQTFDGIVMCCVLRAISMQHERARSVLVIWNRPNRVVNEPGLISGALFPKELWPSFRNLLHKKNHDARHRDAEKAHGAR